jgi:hypothetical protein
MAAVKANDIDRMGELWGSERGPASGYRSAEYLRKTLTVFQKYFNHTGYRVVEGPSKVQGKENLMNVRIELQRPTGCNIQLPIDLIRANSGGWLVFDVHLEAAGNPAVVCKA